MNGTWKRVKERGGLSGLRGEKGHGNMPSSLLMATIYKCILYKFRDRSKATTPRGFTDSGSKLLSIAVSKAVSTCEEGISTCEIELRPMAIFVPEMSFIDKHTIELANITETYKINKTKCSITENFFYLEGKSIYSE